MKMTKCCPALFSIATFIVLPVAASADETRPAPIVGAWASGDADGACEAAPITHFMSDGVVAVFLKKDGPLHSIGSWSATDAQITMTHNDFPLRSDGVSKPLVLLDILTLDGTRLITRNVEGRERARIRCHDIEITIGNDHEKN